jgi:hypothetical protein
MMQRGAKLGRLGAAVAALTLAFALPPLTSAGIERHTFATEVHVTFTDRALFVTPSRLAQTGPAMIVVANNGHALHVLAIKGPGLSGVRTERVAPGGSAQLRLKLLAGSYALSDPVGLGKAKVRWLVVTSNIVGPPVSAASSQHSPTNAVTTTAMDCAL